MPSQDNWALGGIKQLDGTIEFSLIITDALSLGRKLRRGSLPVKLARGLLSVFRDVHENRARTTATGDQEGFPQAECHVLRSFHDHVVFCDRHSDPGDVNFLKRVGTQNLAAHLTGNAHDWRGIQHRRSYAGDHVGGAGAGGGHSYTHSAACASVPVSHMRSTLFVAHKDVVQL